VIAGHSFLGGGVAESLGLAARIRDVPVSGTTVRVADGDQLVLLQRHGELVSVPAPWIDHHAHAAALGALGCDRVLALSSVGSLHSRYPVGTVLIPDDFISLGAQPDSRFRDARGHSVPRFEPRWRRRVVAAWNRHAANPAVDTGVYWQTVGPRFETPAEIRMLAMFADVVGMTVGAECVAFGERGIDYAAVTVVDNLANGVEGVELSVAQFEAGKAANHDMLVRTLPGVIGELAP
jgi:5'-methylthioadenosine phosphorylase